MTQLQSVAGWGHLKAQEHSTFQDGAHTWLTVDAVSWELSWGCQPEQLCMCDLSIWIALLKVWWLCSKKQEMEAAGLLRPRNWHSVPSAIFFVKGVTEHT